ncbi:MAG: glycosyltransferase [Rhodospirillales bacterium]|nr:glycosyltransferase [Rhodospirillales bacterium]
MKLLQAMAGAEFGGAEAFFTRLAVAFEQAGLSQKVTIRKNQARANQLRGGGVEPVELSFGGRLDFRTPMALKRQINEFQPDIVLTWMNRATRMCPAPKDKNFLQVARLGGYYDLKYYKNCDHLIGNTQDIVDYVVKEGWPKERAHYLPNFVSSKRVPAISRKEFFTPTTVPLIVALGRLHENKAFDVLLKALNRVSDPYLWIVGEGPLRQELEALAGKLAIKPRVRFLGWRDDVEALYAAADIFICPSRHEPLGNVVLEAWAQGKPVIAADSLGPGILIQNEVNGLLVPVDDDQAMASALKWLIKEPDFAEELAQAGQAAYEKDFTEEAVVSQYFEFFERILQEKN